MFRIFAMTVEHHDWTIWTLGPRFWECFHIMKSRNHKTPIFPTLTTIHFLSMKKVLHSRYLYFAHTSLPHRAFRIFLSSTKSLYIKFLITSNTVIRDHNTKVSRNFGSFFAVTGRTAEQEVNMRRPIILAEYAISHILHVFEWESRY